MSRGNGKTEGVSCLPNGLLRFESSQPYFVIPLSLEARSPSFSSLYRRG